MDKITRNIDEILPILQKRLKYGSRTLKKLPKGYLTSEKRRGSSIPVWVTNESGSRRRISLYTEENISIKPSSEENLPTGKRRKGPLSDGRIKYKNSITIADCIRSMLMAEYVKSLEIECETLVAMKKAATQVASKHRGKESQNVGRALYEIKQALPTVSDATIMSIYDEIFGNSLSQPELDWQNAPYEHFDGFEDSRGQLTSRGLKVRSKSELLIAEKLYENNIAFRYEQVIRNDEFIVVPDFTILRRDGKLFYWEHMGLTSSKQYLDRQLQKIRSYASIGITPWDNLILTFDNKNGELDLRIIDSEIQNKLQL